MDDTIADAHLCHGIVYEIIEQLLFQFLPMGEPVDQQILFSAFAWTIFRSHEIAICYLLDMFGH